jgi:RimJ/RimL family protein N-acetyltransferase
MDQPLRGWDCGPGLGGRSRPRRQGLGKQIIQAVLAHPELGETELVRAGIEPDNQASVRPP